MYIKAIMLVSCLLLSNAARAADDALPAISRKVVEGNGHRIHVVTVNLAHPDVKGVVATPWSLRGAVVSRFARDAGAVAAVNGDFYDDRLMPLGLTVSNGVAWPRSSDTPGWSFIACTATKDCFNDTSGAARPADPAWQTVVGGKHVLLDGDFVWSPSDDALCGDLCTTAHPRTAVGLSADRKTLFLVVIEGRQPALTGLPLSATARYLRDLGAQTALNFDGGASSELVWDSKIVSGRPTRMPEEREVANHLGVVVVHPLGEE